MKSCQAARRVWGLTISDTIKPGDKFQEDINKVSTAEVDRYVTPFGRKTVTLNLLPGSQSLSIVGQAVIVGRGTRTDRRESPNARIAVVSKLKFEEDLPGTISRSIKPRSVPRQGSRACNPRVALRLFFVSFDDLLCCELPRKTS